MREHAHLALCPDIKSAQLKELNQTRWSKRLDELLAQNGKTSHDIVHSRKNRRKRAS